MCFKIANNNSLWQPLKRGKANGKEEEMCFKMNTM